LLNSLTGEMPVGEGRPACPDFWQNWTGSDAQRAPDAAKVGKH
jgi:hypothetical protein